MRNKHLTLSHARLPREVNQHTHARCLSALRQHAGNLSPREAMALQVVAAAGEAARTVLKAEMDLAFGILGRVERMPPSG